MNRQDILRVIDANLNRTFEGLRTIEEISRFACNDSDSTESLKGLRHTLQNIAVEFDRAELLAARDVAGDVGTSITTESEMKRIDSHAIVAAAAQRVQQSLRCLEEFSKWIQPESSSKFEALRYRSYDVLRDMELRLLGSFPIEAQLYVLIDFARPIEQFKAFLRNVINAGVDLVQLRAKEVDDRKWIAYGNAAIEAMQGSQAKLIINDRIDIAMAIHADGVHLGQEDMPIEIARQIVGRSMWIGVSTHNIEQAREAQSAGADYIGCGPTFPSETKSFEAFAGTDFLRQVAQEILVPAFAIGGIGPSRIAEVVNAGFRRIAVSHCIHGATEPSEVARSLKSALGQENAS